MFYLITILGAALIIALTNFFASGIYTVAALAYYIAIVLSGVVAVIAVDGVLAFIARRMPERWFSPEAKLFSVPEREKRLYKKIKIESWKKYVPELGCFTGFHKDKMRDPRKSEYIGRFLLESNYGVLGHVLGAIFGFLIMLLPFLNPLSMALPIAIVNFVLSTLPTMILRYNTPSLRKLYRRNLEREERAKNNKGE
jgi:glycosyl-4,4'-diaponeurosporenoate acyltransferase